VLHSVCNKKSRCFKGCRGPQSKKRIVLLDAKYMNTFIEGLLAPETEYMFFLVCGFFFLKKLISFPKAGVC